MYLQTPRVAVIPPCRLRLDLVLFALCIAVFATFPDIDLRISALFYNPVTDHWPLKDWIGIEIIYRLFAKIHILILLVLIPLAWHCRRRYTATRQKWLYSFLLASILVGPGIVSHVILKDNSIGRARPNDIVEFGGQDRFTSPFSYSGECRKNCSFVSGHAAIGFYFVGLGWLTGSAWGYYIGVVIGAIVGGTRILQGGHFLSDVVFAFWVVHFCNLWLSRRFQLAHPLGEPVSLSGALWRRLRPSAQN